MPQPVMVIFGRPNVGKSTLFNRLTGTHSAVIDAQPGVTRDRHYGFATIEDVEWILIDTGGFTQRKQDPLQPLLNQQVDIALEEADLIVWVLDAQSGCLPEERALAHKLRQYPQPKLLCVNKAENLTQTEALADFHALGLTDCCAISTAHNHHIEQFKTRIHTLCPKALKSFKDTPQTQNAIHLAIIGRPNVGKSTLTNALLKAERMLVSNIAGTTRDSIHSPLHYKQQDYILIDTAGVRRKSQVAKKQLEGYTVIHALRSIQEAEVVLIVIDATEGVTDQDCQLIRCVIEAGRGLVIALNKSDALIEDQRYHLERSVDDRLNFIHYCDHHLCSGKQHRGLHRIMQSVKRAYLSTQKRPSTSALTTCLEQAQINHPPPMIKGRRIKLRFAHLSSGSPPYIVIHGKQTDALPKAYHRYLENTFRKHFKLKNMPIRLSFRSDSNPYIQKT